MDTSETYIKMCDCPEIQGGRRHEVLDVWQYAPDGKHVDHWSQVWLPRQDQLQEMVLEDESYWRYQRYQSDARYLDIIDDIRAFFHGKCGQGADLILSLEQLWLAFVMKEKHGKVWSGSEWGME